jgi:hypothetical protein
MSLGMTLKGIVLLMAVPVGAAFGWWGYRLYELGVSSTVAAGGSYQDAEFWFNGAGPGLAFAIAGAFIIIAAITRKFEIEDTDSSGRTRKMRGAGPPPRP